MRAEHADAPVQLARERVHLGDVARRRLLPPRVRHGAQDREQRGRGGQHDVAVECVLQQVGTHLERRAEQRLVGQEQHDELEGVVAAPVLLGAQLVDVRDDVGGVLGEEPPRGLVVGRLDRLEVRRHRHLGVDDDVPVVGEVHDEVGAQQVVALGAGARLLLEVHVAHEAGRLHDPAQLHLAPLPAHVGAAQSRGEPTGLGAQRLRAGGGRADLGREVGVGAGPLGLGGAQVERDAGRGSAARARRGPRRRPARPPAWRARAVARRRRTTVAAPSAAPRTRRDDQGKEIVHDHDSPRHLRQRC